MKAHVIEQNKIVNTIIVNSIDELPNLVEATNGAIGWSYIDGVFSEPVIVKTDEEKSKEIRFQRNILISKTDWMACSDVNMSAEWASYRQALRDITDHVNFPDLEDSDWPEAP